MNRTVLTLFLGLAALSVNCVVRAGTEEPGRTASGAVSIVTDPFTVKGVTGGVMRSGVEQGTYFPATWKFWQKSLVAKVAEIFFEKQPSEQASANLLKRELVGAGLHQTLKSTWEIKRPFINLPGVTPSDENKRECYLFLGATLPQQAYVSIYELAQLERSAINEGRHGLGLWTFDEMDLEAFADPNNWEGVYFTPMLIPFTMDQTQVAGTRPVTVDIELPVHFRYWPPAKASEEANGTVRMRSPRVAAVACPESIEAGVGYSILPEEYLADGIQSSSEGAILVSNFDGRSSDVDDYDNFDDVSTVQLNVTALNHPLLAYRGWNLLSIGYKGDTMKSKGTVFATIPRGQVVDQELVVNVTLGATVLATIWLLYAACCGSSKTKAVEKTPPPRKSGRKGGKAKKND